MTAPNPILTHALAYSQRGWAVLPCRPGTKAPATARGFYDATTDAKRVRAWWTAWPDANLAIRTGAASGLLVLDIDLRNGGDRTFQQLEAALGPLPATAPRVRTPHGGQHVYLGYPAGLTIRSRAHALGPGVDVKAEGGYVLAPPSRVALADGTTGAYTWLVPPAEDGTPPPPVPPAWLARILADERAVPPVAERIAEPIPEGRRHNTLVALAGKLHGTGVDVEAIAATLAAVNAAHCLPPLPDDEVRAIAASAGRWAPNPVLKAPARDEADDEASDDDADERRRGGRRNAAARLVQLVGRAGVDFFHDAQQRAWATVPAEGERGAATVPLRGVTFRAWLSARFYEETGRPAPAQAVQDASAVLEHHALRGEERPVAVRLAGDLAAGWLALDLGRPDGLAVTITRDGWTVGPPPDGVRFYRPKSLRPLPDPVPAPPIALFELHQLWPHLADSDVCLAIAYLLMALHPHGPYPILAPTGEAGIGKTLFCKLVRSVVDPQFPAVRRPAREEREVFIAATNAHVIVLDNLTTVSDWLADALCVLATGGGYGMRTLYETAEETVLNVTRPVIVNAVYLNARQDLADRTWPISIPPLPDDARVDEATVWDRFTALHPRVLGALLSAASAALRCWPTTKSPAVTRMADAVRWITAAEHGGGLPWPAGTVAALLGEQRQQVAREHVLQSAVADAVLKVVAAAGGTWAGTTLQLLRLLDDLVPPAERPRDWPRTAESLALALRRLAPELRRAGLLDVDRYRTGHDRARVLVIRTLTPPPPPPPPHTNQSELGCKEPSAPPAPSARDGGDGGGRGETSWDGVVADRSADRFGPTRPQPVRTLSAHRPHAGDGIGRHETVVDNRHAAADGADSADSVLRPNSGALAQSAQVPTTDSAGDDGWEVWRL